MTKRCPCWGGQFISVAQYQHSEIWAYLSVHDPAYLRELEAASD